MVYLEMSRVESHGGGGWAFPYCIWAPSEKKGGGRWPFWEKVLAVREEDTILHLRGVSPQAFFVGYSQVTSGGIVTSHRPPDPGEWSYAKKFYRATLANFTQFHQPINLVDLFVGRRLELERYFDRNKESRSSKKHIFYVKQAGRLQCLNGAYLSDVDAELFEIMFGPVQRENQPKRISSLSVETKWQLAQVRVRLGQADFSRRIKDLYANRCCFPGCGISDSRFLVASHIARWSDNERLRGHLGNGLCLCLVHDKAFELGLFTLDENCCVYVNPREVAKGAGIVSTLLQGHGRPIAFANIRPLEEAILEHWLRVDVSP